ncbi:MAG: hypothetical protein HOH66_04430 [Rhodospirillaceae bacterium]|jgi:hypothetical protein|nr:hypothetical protein [Rhodospirillaceae bacterium]MBT6117092.1 hypothetical protein [Rhodospirillaceae bacterium]
MNTDHTVEFHDDDLSDEALDLLSSEGRFVGTVGTGGGKTVGTAGCI